MQETPATRASLLVRLRDGGDTAAWGEFVRLYAPVIYGFARKRGLQDADAADLMQEVLRSIARNAGKMEYDPKRGTFRGWLYTVTRNKIYNFLNGQRHRPRGTGDSAAHERLDAVPDRTEDPDAEWDLEYQRQVSAKAMERVRHEFHKATWQAFWETGVVGTSAASTPASTSSMPARMWSAPPAEPPVTETAAPSSTIASTRSSVVSYGESAGTTTTSASSVSFAMGVVSSMRLADAFVRADKRFDLLVLPGQNHALAYDGDGPPDLYWWRRTIDYLVEHLDP